MTDKSAASPADDAADLRGTLIRRLAMAGVLVAVLLGVLAFFDHLATTPEEPEAPVFTQPVPVAPRKEVSQPVTLAEPAAEPGAESAAAAAPVETPPPPVVAAAPASEVEQPGGAKTGDAPRRPASSPVSPAPAVAPLPRPAPVVEETAPPQPVAPAARVVAARPPAAPRLFSGFLLQAGVFSSAQLAEELHAKLTLSGVPSTLETRVQVGPFRTRQEAEAAQARLKELGIQTILVAPAARR